MAILTKEAVDPVSVTVSVPKSSADSVVIREAATRTRLCSIRQEAALTDLSMLKGH
jgi:hypothetical protein